MKIALLRHGPVNVAIDASPRTFSFYSHGVYYEKKWYTFFSNSIFFLQLIVILSFFSGNKVDELNHTVLVVGYGDMNGKSYWLVRNSWSSLWGINGYVCVFNEHSFFSVAPKSSTNMKKMSTNEISCSFQILMSTRKNNCGVLTDATYVIF